MKKLIFLMLFVMCGFANADPVNTPAAVPQMLHVYDTAGHAYVDMPPHDCAGGRYHLHPSHAKYDAVFSVLLSAQVANKKVVVRFDGCSSHTSPHGEIVGVYLSN